MRSRAEDDTIGHLRIDDGIDTIAKHDDEDVVVKAKVALGNRTIASFDEERARRLVFTVAGGICERSTTTPGVNMMNMP